MHHVIVRVFAIGLAVLLGVAALVFAIIVSL